MCEEDINKDWEKKLKDIEGDFKQNITSDNAKVIASFVGNFYESAKEQGIPQKVIVHLLDTMLVSLLRSASNKDN